MASAWAEPDADFHPATCVRHPNGSKEFHFCFDCSRVFCGDCRSLAIDRVDHLSHRTAPLQDVLTQRKERMSAIRQLINDYVNKHDMMRPALQKLEEEQKNQMQELNRIIEDFASQLCREVGNIKNEAKATIAKRAAEIWSASRADTYRKEIEKELKRMRDVRAAIDHEIRLCERDELYLVEKNKDLESFANEFSEFQRKKFEVPDKSCYQLPDLRRELLERMSQLQRELKRAKEVFIKGLQYPFPFPHADQLCLLPNAVITFPKERLFFPNDTSKDFCVGGAIPSANSAETIYFVNVFNSKIKLLNLKASKITEVFSGPSGTQLRGLANVEDSTFGPLIATTEHTSGTPARVRILLLRRSASESLHVVQSAALNETRSDWTSIAQFPGGNLFCAVSGSASLHELCRSSDDATSFDSTARTHRLPAEIRAMCSLQANGERRLVASFADNTLRVFRFAGGTLNELQRVAQPHANWRPFELVALPGGSLTLCSFFEDRTNSKWMCGIECCAAQPDGSLAAPKRLHSQELGFGLHGLLPPTYFSPTFRLIAFNYANRELCLHSIKPN